MLPVFRSACRSVPLLSRKYSVNTGTANLLEILDDQSKRPSSTNLAQVKSGGRKWKAFEPNHFVRPHEFTYKSRLIAEPAYRTRRPAVGPPPSAARFHDVFHQFDIDPLSLVMNREVLSTYVSEMGKIYGRNVTGLTSKSQRRLGKAIRRAKMMGIIPVLSRATNLRSNYIPRSVSHSP